MSLKLFIGGVPVPVIHTVFPAGETCLRINRDARDCSGMVRIVMEFEGNKDLFDLALLMDAAKRHFYPANIDGYALNIDYLPYARQDRVCNPGESLSVKVVADFINSLGFDHVVCKDIHSPVGAALIDNLRHADLGQCIGRMVGMSGWIDRDNTVLVSPDAGANKKVLEVAKQYRFPHVVRADKTRDVLTGKITGTVVYSEPVGDKNFLIVDDLIDAGGTFIPLAEELKKLTTGKVFLYVTHGLFTAGIDKFHGVFDKIYVSNNMMKDKFSDTYGIMEVV